MAKIDLIGAPFSVGTREETSFAIDQQRAPALIRHALDELLAGFDIQRHFTDTGDITSITELTTVLNHVSRRVSETIDAGKVPFLLGGAHTLTLGSLRALKKSVGKFSLIYFDAHPDLMPHPTINYGSSLYYAIHEGVLAPEQVALIGVRQIERAEMRFMKEHGIYFCEAIEFERLGAKGVLEQIKKRFKPPYCISLDLDAIEPAYCPGVTTPFPGGITFREMLFVANELCRDPVKYLDLVELSPINDVNGVSARLAATLLMKLTETVAHAAGEGAGRKRSTRVKARKKKSRGSAAA